MHATQSAASSYHTPQHLNAENGQTSRTARQAPQYYQDNQDRQWGQSPQQNGPSASPRRVIGTENALALRANVNLLPSVTFSPRTTANVTVGLQPFPGSPSVAGGATLRFEPKITVRPTEQGGINFNFAPSVEVDFTGTLNVLSVPNLFKTGLGVNVGGSFTQRFAVGGPSFSFNLNPDGSFKASAGLHPTVGATQILNGALEGNISVLGVEGSASQNVGTETEFRVRIGGQDVEYAVSPGSAPKVSVNRDNTVSITNQFTLVPGTNVAGAVTAGPLRGSVGGAVWPTLTFEHEVTLKPSLNPRQPIEATNKFSVTPGIRFDGNVSAGVSLFPPDSPLSVTATIGANPNVTVTGPQASITQS